MAIQHNVAILLPLNQLSVEWLCLILLILALKFLRSPIYLKCGLFIGAKWVSWRILAIKLSAQIVGRHWPCGNIGGSTFFLLRSKSKNNTKVLYYYICVLTCLCFFCLGRELIFKNMSPPLISYKVMSRD